MKILIILLLIGCMQQPKKPHSELLLLLQQSDPQTAEPNSYGYCPKKCGDQLPLKDEPGITK